MEVENVKPYAADGGKTRQVEEMFDAIAPAYDFMNRAMTFGLCRRWRDRALKRAAGMLAGRGTYDILDVATGTGDVALALLRRFPEARISGVDLSGGMLEVARAKAAALAEADRRRVCFEKGDSMALPYADASFDMVTVAYGVRNYADLARGLAEMSRTLRPGGLLCVIELSEPANPLLRWGYRLYARHLIPLAGRRVSGDRSAYSYLPASIAACPQRDGMTRLMEQAGLSECVWKSLTLGVVTLYYGKKGL